VLAPSPARPIEQFNSSGTAVRSLPRVVDGTTREYHSPTNDGNGNHRDLLQRLLVFLTFAIFAKFEEWGIIDAVLEKGLKVEHLQYWERDSRKIVADFDYKSLVGETKYPFRLQCPQNVVTAIAKQKLEVSHSYGLWHDTLSH
jgi:hypothetical protein